MRRLNGWAIRVDPVRAHAFLVGGLERGDLGFEALSGWLRRAIEKLS